jgi:hypothetical protein
MRLSLGEEGFKQAILPDRSWVIRQAIKRGLPIPAELPPEWFKGISSRSAPGDPAVLHFCPGCERAVKEAIFGGDIRGLPAGALKNLLRKMRHRALPRGGC